VAAAGSITQELKSADDVIPAPQDTQTEAMEAPVLLEAYPTAHGWQSESEPMPGKDEKVPLGHGEQVAFELAASAPDHVPIGQYEHFERPVESAKLPGAQG